MSIHVTKHKKLKCTDNSDKIFELNELVKSYTTELKQYEHAEASIYSIEPSEFCLDNLNDLSKVSKHIEGIRSKISSTQIQISQLSHQH